MLHRVYVSCLFILHVKISVCICAFSPTLLKRMSNNQHKKKAAILPTWVLRLIGYSSLAAAIISFVIYWFKKYPPRRGITSNEVDLNRCVMQSVVLMSMFRGIIVDKQVIITVLAGVISYLKQARTRKR